MIIKVTGINGYIGQLLQTELKSINYDVSGISRKVLYKGGADLVNEIRHSDVTINLAGAPILKRWTPKNRKTIYSSRVITTQNLVEAINLLPPNEQPKKFISASAIGLYKSEYSHNERSTNFDQDFVGNLVIDWEKSLEKLPPTVQKTVFRIGLVLGKEAKTIKNLLFPFRLGLGGSIGSGKQAFPFIHEKDLINAFVWAIKENTNSGVFNLVAPEQINNMMFTQEMARQLKQPAIFKVPPVLLKVIFGKASKLLLKSPFVEPLALHESGFQFEYPTIESTLAEILT